MTENQNVTLTPTKAQTYIHLGIIAANTGYGEMLYETNQQITSGDRNPLEDMGAWFAEQVTLTDDLAELHSFRNRLLHGSVIVEPDGSIQVFDRREHTQLRPDPLVGEDRVVQAVVVPDPGRVGGERLAGPRGALDAGTSSCRTVRLLTRRIRLDHAGVHVLGVAVSHGVGRDDANVVLHAGRQPVR